MVVGWCTFVWRLHVADGGGSREIDFLLSFSCHPRWQLLAKTIACSIRQSIDLQLRLTNTNTKTPYRMRLFIDLADAINLGAWVVVWLEGRDLVLSVVCRLAGQTMSSLTVIPRAKTTTTSDNCQHVRPDQNHHYLNVAANICRFIWRSRRSLARAIVACSCNVYVGRRTSKSILLGRPLDTSTHKRQPGARKLASQQWPPSQRLYIQTCDTKRDDLVSAEWQSNEPPPSRPVNHFKLFKNFNLLARLADWGFGDMSIGAPRTRARYYLEMSECHPLLVS